MFAAISEALVGDGSFRVVDVAAWALVLIWLGCLLAVMEWLKQRWAEALAFGVGLALLGLAADLGCGDGFDWVYVSVALVGGTVGWYAVLWVGGWFSRRVDAYRNRRQPG